MSGITWFSKNAFSVISDADSYVPGFDTTSLERIELFTYKGVGQNLMPDAELPTVVGTPTEISGTPFYSFSNNANVAHLNLGIQDSAAQTWFVLFDPNSDPTQRLVMSSYAGTSVSTLPGAGIMISASGALQLGLGYHDTSTDAYSVSFATLTGFDFTKPALLCVTLDGKTGTITNLTSGNSASVTLSASRERVPNTIRVGKGAVNLWGSVTATSRIAAYAVFNRVLSVDEKALVKSYFLECIQEKFPLISF
ncbi:hypothetical protein L3496_25270 [Klebsiella pneumoniae]|uniref:hypothetical protein n=1 Tax=Klebsiella pneumoniae TaxID=573 RepID=UPI000D74F1FD|nr:hypothetical protein [Klebsiella pneumoniae]MDG0022426.1 hypothetical protein [Klebsiella pneumoniae]PXG86086.1 hypothetical protein DMP59_03395 [Klebsiella pneumoniae]